MVFPATLADTKTKTSIMQTKLMEYLKQNSNATKLAIGEALQLKGLPLFNLLKKAQTDGVITANGEGSDVNYSLNENYSEVQVRVDQPEVEEIKETTDVIEEAGAAAEQPQETIAETGGEKTAGRDNTTYLFNKETFKKGPLVRAVLSKYVQDHPTVTYAKLKEVFGDDLLKRFGIFQEEAKAREISGKSKVSRYFTKPEHVIQLADKKIVVCNQFTAANIQPFLKVARTLYKIK